MEELKTKKDEELKELEDSLNFEKVHRKIFEDNFNITDEVKLREKASEKISKTEELIGKKEIDLEHFFDIDNRYVDLLIQLDINKMGRNEELFLIETKLEKLKISKK